MLDDLNMFLAPTQTAGISTNIIDTDIDFYRIVRPDQKQKASASNLPTSHRNVFETKVFVNGVSVTFDEVEDGGIFQTFSSSSYRTESGKYKIRLHEFPPLQDEDGNATVVKYVIERYTYPDWYQIGDDPDTVLVETEADLRGRPERSSGPTAWKNLDDSDVYIKANSIIEWNGSRWVSVFDPDEVATNVYITNLRTGIQYKWDGVQWLKSFEGEYLPGSWRLTLNP